MPDRHPTIAAELRRGLHRLAVATVGVYVALAAVILVALFVFILPSHDALCGIRSDLKQRVAQSEQFVKDKPELLKQFGLTEEEVQIQIENQKRTIDQLSDVPFCGEA